MSLVHNFEVENNKTLVRAVSVKRNYVVSDSFAPKSSLGEVGKDTLFKPMSRTKTTLDQLESGGDVQVHVHSGLSFVFFRFVYVIHPLQDARPL